MEVVRDVAVKRIHLNPLAGYQGPVQLKRAFLLAPNVLLRLSGVSISAAWKKLKAESPIKTLEYHRARGGEPPTRLVNELIGLLRYPDAQEAFRNAFDAAARGDNPARSLWVKKGFGKTSCVGCGGERRRCARIRDTVSPAVVNGTARTRTGLWGREAFGCRAMLDPQRAQMGF